jgi:hypothetical protein
MLISRLHRESDDIIVIIVVPRLSKRNLECPNRAFAELEGYEVREAKALLTFMPILQCFLISNDYDLAQTSLTQGMRKSSMGRSISTGALTMRPRRMPLRRRRGRAVALIPARLYRMNRYMCCRGGSTGSRNKESGEIYV